MTTQHPETAPPAIRELSLLETTKAVRLTLAAQFAEIKFSVRSNRHNWAPSITASYSAPNPTHELHLKIIAFADKLCGSTYDLSDAKIACYHWLLPNGQIQFANSPDEMALPADLSAELVQLGADSVDVNFI